MVEIKCRETGKVLYEGPEGNVKDLVERLVKEGKSLRNADLFRADLFRADLRGSLLEGADLRGADLRGADLRGANLRGADLKGTVLRGANLGEVYLGVRAYLGRADLRGADLQGADLRGAYFYGAALEGADLKGTVLDPENKPNGKGLESFERTESGRCIGYRTRESAHVGLRAYKDKETCTALVFSTCEEAGHHPGLYLWPTLARAKAWAESWATRFKIIKVTFDPKDLHGVWDKYRVKRFTVVGEV